MIVSYSLTQSWRVVQVDEAPWTKIFTRNFLRGRGVDSRPRAEILRDQRHPRIRLLSTRLRDNTQTFAESRVFRGYFTLANTQTRPFFCRAFLLLVGRESYASTAVVTSIRYFFSCHERLTISAVKIYLKKRGEGGE